MLYIKDATIYSRRETVARGAVVIEGERIIDAGPEDHVKCPHGATVLDAQGAILAPGFIDLQFNGGFGRDFTAEPSSIWDVARLYPRFGVTGFLPTVITSPFETIAQAQKAVMDRPHGFRGANPLGLHIEGPFINAKKKGAHNAAYIREPSLDLIRDWSPANGVRLVTLAPELPGALDVIAALAGRGVLVSAGHSMATYDQAIAGFDAGIRYGTHLFNAMPPFAHREPGLPGALLADPRVAVGFIADGIHTHPSVIEVVWRVLGSRRMSLVTDAMAALGMPAGDHVLGDYTVHVDASSARLADGTLAGSILSPDQALRNIIRLTGCPLSEALATLTSLPANLLDIAGELGAVSAGYRADLVLLSEDLHVKATIAAGEIVYQ